MAAKEPFSGYQIFMGFGITATTLLAGAIFVQMLTQAEKLGDHGARLQIIENSTTSTLSNLVNLQYSVDQGFAKVDGALENLKITLDKNATDPASMIASLGLAEPGEIFGAAIYRDALWAFPASEAMAVRLQASGLQRQQVNSALHGFKIMSVNGVGHIAPPAQQ